MFYFRDLGPVLRLSIVCTTLTNLIFYLQQNRCRTTENKC